MYKCIRETLDIVQMQEGIQHSLHLLIYKKSIKYAYTIVLFNYITFLKWTFKTRDLQKIVKKKSDQLVHICDLKTNTNSFVYMLATVVCYICIKRKYALILAREIMYHVQLQRMLWLVCSSVGAEQITTDSYNRILFLIREYANHE